MGKIYIKKWCTEMLNYDFCFKMSANLKGTPPSQISSATKVYKIWVNFISKNGVQKCLKVPDMIHNIIPSNFLIPTLI